MTAAGAEVVGSRGGWRRLGLFVLLAALTGVEVGLAASGGDARLRMTALCGLLLLKTGLLLAFSLQATLRRPGPRLVLLALVTAAGFTVVLMLEAAYRAGLR